MAQTGRSVPHPVDQPLADSPSLPLRREATGATQSPAVPLSGGTQRLVQAEVAHPRLCVLCGGPLRAGQRLLRVHGSTIHARCTSAGG